MNGEQIRQTIENCISGRLFCSVLNKFEYEYRHLLPVKSSEGLFLSMIESGMSLDGCLIERFENVGHAVPAGDFARRIADREGVFDSLEVPPIEIDTFSQIFAYLVNNVCPVCLECGSTDDRAITLLTGLVTDCSDVSLRFQRFGNDLRWAGKPVTIPYEAVVRLTFGTRALSDIGKILPKR